MARKIAILIATVITLFCIWMVYMAASVGDTGGLWFFAAFAFLSGAFSAALVISMARKKNAKGPSPGGVRFIPHWQMMTLIGAALAAVAAGILISIWKS